MRNFKIKLNRSDFLFLVADEVFAAMGQVITLRFTRPHSIEVMRAATRFLLSAYPRLRSVVVPTFFSYEIQIFEDTARRVDVLFEDAFSVKRNLAAGTPAYERFRRDLLNESFSLQQSLPIKFRYLPDDPRPVLLISIHHLACDGMSYIHMLNTLMACLNGGRPTHQPLDDPSLKPILWKKNPFNNLRRLVGSFKAFRLGRRTTRNDCIIQASSRPVDYFSPVDAHLQVLSRDLATLLERCRTLGCTLTELMLAALALAFLRRTPSHAGNTAGILTTFNLRPYFKTKKPLFGNYVRAVLVRGQRALADRPGLLLESVRGQMADFRNQIETGKILYPWMAEEGLKLLGKKTCARLALAAQRDHRFPMTCHHSNLGNLDSLNAHGPVARVCEAIASTPHRGLLMVMASLGGRIQTSMTYPEAEFSRDEIEDFYFCLETAIEDLLALEDACTTERGLNATVGLPFKQEA